ncbi:hypothetical protein [Wolbachia pipientis]|nr:hypothetical protein [Wolbachia pipientis]
MNRGMTVCGGMTVKQFVIPQRDLLLAPRRYDGSRWHLRHSAMC